MTVIEIARMRLRPGVTDSDFAAQNQVVDRDYARAQPGFMSREFAKADDGEWIVVVHWDTTQDADASMAKFTGDPIATDFMALIDAATLNMTRYQTTA